MIIYLHCYVVNDYSQLLAESVDDYSLFTLLFRIMIVSEMIRILGYKRESGDRVVTGKVYQRHTFCPRNKDHFLAAVRKFMEMETLTSPLLRELIDHIDVYETQGTGKHRTQRITIFYRFVGYIDIPESPDDEPYTADTRQGVAVKYIPKLA